jgi:hypothetical protein
MSWLDRLFKDNSRKEIECELLDETDTTIKVKFGIHITFLPKNLISFDRPIEENTIQVRIPIWLFRKSFI